MNRNNCIAALVCVNLLLLTGIVLASTSPPAAIAQDVNSLGGNYMVVTGEIQDQFDALYILDMKSRNLYAFAYDRGRRQVDFIALRNLERDFRNKD